MGSEWKLQPSIFISKHSTEAFSSSVLCSLSLLDYILYLLIVKDHTEEEEEKKVTNTDLKVSFSLVTCFLCANIQGLPNEG